MTACLWLIVKKKDLIRKGDVQLSKNNQTVNKHTSRLLIAVFGLGGTLYLICKVVHRAVQTQASYSVNNFGLLISFIVYVVAIYKYSGLSLKNKSIFHYGIALMIGTNAWGWIIITVTPLYGVLVTDNSSSWNATNSSNSTEQYGSATAIYVLDILESFFQPFLVEFLTISSGCLLTLWQTMRYSPNVVKTRPAYRSDTLGESIHSDANDTLQLQNELRQTTGELKCTSEKLGKRIATIFSILLAAACFIGYHILSDGPFSKVSDHLDVNTRATYAKAIVAVFYIPLVFMNAISLVKLHRDKTKLPIHAQLSSSGYLLLFTSAAAFIFNFERFVAEIGVLCTGNHQLETSTLIMYTIYTVSVVAHSWIQTHHIMTVNYIHRSGGKIPKFSKFTLIYLIAINFNEWISGSFAHKWVESVKDPILIREISPELVIFFGHFNTKIIILLFIPLLEMLSFHSAMMACECFQ